MTAAVLFAEHPAWIAPAGHPPHTRARLVSTGDGVWLASYSPDNGPDLVCLSGDDTIKPRFQTTGPESLPCAAPSELRAALAEMGPAVRLSNPSLWDTVATAILRQVVQAHQARKIYRAWCAAYGTTVATRFGRLSLCPGPATVLKLGDEDFARVGARFFRDGLKAAATAYLEHGGHWHTLASADLITALTAVPRIGPWTAHAAAADHTGDFAHYPHDDLAVRTWAKRAAPDHPWPATGNKHADTRSFGDTWRSWPACAPELHTLTLLTLTWGTRHGNREPDPDPAPAQRTRS